MFQGLGKNLFFNQRKEQTYLQTWGPALTWPSNYQPDLAISKHDTLFQFGLFKEKMTFSGSWQLEISYQPFDKGGDTSFAFLRCHRF